MVDGAKKVEGRYQMVGTSVDGMILYLTVKVFNQLLTGNHYLPLISDGFQTACVIPI